jgi:hypothetical protein
VAARSAGNNAVTMAMISMIDGVGSGARPCWAGCTAMNDGPFKPVAKTDPTPAGVKASIELLLKFVTYTFPASSIARPSGWFRPVVAKTEPTPPGVSFSMLLPPTFTT